MADKGERIWLEFDIPKPKGAIEATRCTTMTRQEAIERMAKAICKISCACKYDACGNCTEFLEHYTPDLPEAALNSLLEGK